MAISVNPGNFSGLAQLAGTQFRPYADEIAAKREATAQQGALARQKMLLQGGQSLLQMAQQDKRAGERMALAERAAARDDARFEAQQGIAERKLDLEAQRMEHARIMQQEKLSMQKLLADKKENISAMGAFATNARLKMEDAGDPEEAKSLQDDFIDQAIDNKFIEKEEGAKLKKLPISKFKDALDFQIMKLGKVREYYNIKGKLDKAEGKGAQGGMTITRPDGTTIQIAEPTAPVKTQLQKDIIDRTQALKELAPIRQNFNKEYLTYRGQAGLEASKMAEKAEGIPIVGDVLGGVAGALTGRDPKDREKFVSDATSYLNAVERFFQQRYRKPITGAQAAINELKVLRKSFLSGDMSPSEFQGALDSIVQNYAGEADFKKNVLQEGVDTTTQDQLIQNTIQHYKQKGWTDQQIQDALKARGY